MDHLYHRLCNCKCPPPPNTDDLDLKNVWIVFLVNKDSEIISLEIYERNMEDIVQSTSIFEYVNRYLNGTRYKDMGCVSSTWKHITLVQILLKLFVDYGFQNKDVAIEAIRSLYRIREFKNDLIL